MIDITDITVLSNPSRFGAPFELQISFTCLTQTLEHDLEWQLSYAGADQATGGDQIGNQELESVEIGPVPQGLSTFLFSVSDLSSLPLLSSLSCPSQAAAPTLSEISKEDLAEAAVIVLIASYNNAEFIRVGYFIKYEFEHGPLKAKWDAAELDPALQRPKMEENIHKLMRTIDVDKVRVTKRRIEWSVDITLLLLSGMNAELICLTAEASRDRPAIAPPPQFPFATWTGPSQPATSGKSLLPVAGFYNELRVS